MSLLHFVLMTFAVTSAITCGSAQTCPCEEVLGESCEVVQPVGQSSCIQNSVRCDFCRCRDGGSLTCAEGTQFQYQFTGVGDRCEPRPVSFAECPTPTPTPVAGRWIVAEAGSGCNGACFALGLPCNEGGIQQMNDLAAADPSTAQSVLNAAGVPCPSVEDCATTPVCVSGGTSPGILDGGACYYNTEQTSASCSSGIAVVGFVYQRLCCCGDCALSL